jgi:hypothetical protein
MLALFFSFVFLQLYHTAHFGSTAEKPLLVPQSRAIQRAVKNLDRIPPYETHKVGVIYVGPGQASNEAEILRNQFGSLRYAQFLQVRIFNFSRNFTWENVLIIFHCKDCCYNPCSDKTTIMSIIWWTFSIRSVCSLNLIHVWIALGF